MSDSMHQKFVELDAERGTIYSEDGQMLSTSIPYFDMYIDFGAEGLREKMETLPRKYRFFLLQAWPLILAIKAQREYKKELQHAYNEGPLFPAEESTFVSNNIKTSGSFHWYDWAATEAV